MTSEAAGSCKEHSITEPRPVIEAEVCGPSTSAQQIGLSGAEVQGNGFQGLLPPKYFLKPKLLEAFCTVGAVHKAYTFREILGLLKAYLFQNRTLIDAKESHFVNCGGTPLAIAFRVVRFQYNEVGFLLSQNIVPASSITNQSPSFSLKASSGQNTSRSICNSPVRIPIPKIPESHSGPESDYSWQGYETVYCYDSDDELPPSVSGESEGEGEAEDVEYEPATEEEANKTEDSVDSESDVENLILILGVEEQPDTAEDCFADESDTSTGEESDSLTEDEGDQWSCLTCGIKNKPFFRYCLKCWQLRKDWYPEPPKKRKKRKPRPKKDKRKASLQGRKMGGTDCSDIERKEAKDDFPPFILEREGSTASCSTQVSSTSWASSSASSIVSLSQDSGFGSQDLLTFEAAPTRKRKASEMETNAEGKNEASWKGGTAASLDENDPSLPNLFRKFEKFLGSTNGLRWFRSSQAKEFRETLKNLSSDSDLDQFMSEDRCTICYSRPKDASIIHGRISHIGFCYPCAKRLFKSKSRCPLCRRRIHMITKNSYA